MNRKKHVFRNILFFLALIALGFLIGTAATCSRRAAVSGRGDDAVEPMFAASVARAQSGDTEESRELRRTPVVVAIEKVSPAVVNISTEKIVERRYNPFSGFNDDLFDDFFNRFHDTFPRQRYTQQTLGSGVIIDPKGYILTNDHVVLRASKIQVTLPDEREAEARLIGADPRFDLAILKIDMDHELPAARTGDSDSIMIGETVIAIGNPYGLKHTVTTGVVSALDRSIKTDDGRTFDDFIQTDASINPGNSGGPLVNLAGEVIGINTAIYAGAEGIGFAIPINRAMRAVADLIRFGSIEKTWTGLRLQELTPVIARRLGLDSTVGVLVADVIDNSPASRAGFDTGDVIFKLGGRTVKTLEDFSEKIGGYLVNDVVKVEYVRDRKTGAAEIKMAGLPVDRADELARELFGLTLTEIGAAERVRYRLGNFRGVVVTDVDANSPAAKIGIQPGDLIVAVGNREIGDMKECREAVALASVFDSVFLIVQRGAYRYYVRI